MWIILLCSLVALTIIFERILTLRTKQVAPASLRKQIVELARSGRVTADKIDVVRKHSPLGKVFAAGLDNLEYGPDAMREALEEAGKQVVHRLGRYLNTLGTIASITPLIGLLGTVIWPLHEMRARPTSVLEPCTPITMPLWVIWIRHGQTQILLLPNCAPHESPCN